MCSLECFCLGEKAFAQVRKYSHQAEYFRSGKKWPCFLNHFRPNDKFFTQAKDIFAQAKLVLPRLKKLFFFCFCFWMFNFFGMQCMNLLCWINCYFKLNSINGLVISFIFWDWEMNEWYNRKYLCYVMKMIKCL